MNNNFCYAGARALTSGFTNGRGTIWLDEVRCSGSESWLGSCRSNVIGSHDCGHSKDAGVRCGGKSNLYRINFVAVTLQYDVYVRSCTALIYHNSRNQCGF